MKHSLLVLATLGLIATALPSRAALFITEVHPSGSGNGTYAADWFELTNTGTVSLDITGWKIDDNSNSSAASVALVGVTSIAAGQSVVFLESAAPGTTIAAFNTAWFGSNVPAGFTIGSYTGSGVGLSATSDAVNIYNASGTLQANVVFGAATAARTFDNAAGLNNTTISTLSTAGTNGAFLSANGGETGSPGVVPEPGTYVAVLAGLGTLVFLRKRQGHAL